MSEAIIAEDGRATKDLRSWICLLYIDDSRRFYRLDIPHLHLSLPFYNPENGSWSSRASCKDKFRRRSGCRVWPFYHGVSLPSWPSITADRCRYCFNMLLLGVLLAQVWHWFLWTKEKMFITIIVVRSSHLLTILYKSRRIDEQYWVLFWSIASSIFVINWQFDLFVSNYGTFAQFADSTGRSSFRYHEADGRKEK
jgi:hypothetical protein